MDYCTIFGYQFIFVSAFLCILKYCIAMQLLLSLNMFLNH